jgi:hypothetical protein
MEVRPDHRGSGLFVRQHLAPDDIVIAEDALEQHWYAGRTDRWFRSGTDARKFLFQDENETLRDFYVGSVLQDEPIDHVWIKAAESAIWFITSGETARTRDWYLSPEQAAWLEKVEEISESAYSGRDGLSHVFCFGRCPPGVPVARIP